MAKVEHILLINPPIRDQDVARNIPHGIAILASVLRKEGYKVKVLDINAHEYSKEQVTNFIRNTNADAIGIGGLIPVYRYIKWLAKVIKDYKPNMPIIAGGSVAFSIPELMLNNTLVDIICDREAEFSILEILDAIKSGTRLTDLNDIKGVWYRNDQGEVIKTGERPFIEDLDVLPFPAWDLLPMEEVYLKNPVVGVGRDIDFVSSRGCPYACTFCFQPYGQSFRGHSVDYIIDAFSYLKRTYDVDHISFQDDEFMAKPKRVIEYCERLLSSGLDIYWSSTGRANIASIDLLKVCKESHCTAVSYGIESGSQKILDIIDKKVTVEQAKNAILVNREIGLRAPTSFIIGMPGETRETVQETIDFCKSINLPLQTMMFATPYPGTPLFDYCWSKGIVNEQNLEELVLNMDDCVSFLINLTEGEFTDKELIDMRDYAVREVQAAYIPMSTADMEAFNKNLYGEKLYRKSLKQLEEDKALVEHRKLHGFNDRDVVSYAQ